MSILSRIVAGLVPGRGRQLDLKHQSFGPPLVSLHAMGEAQWAPRSYGAFAREGFMRNPVVYRSVRMIAEAASSVRFVALEAGQPLTEHPLLDLLRKPHCASCATELLEEWYGYLLVSGNAFLEVASVGGEPRELRSLRPDRVRVIAGEDGWPEGYEYQVGTGFRRMHDDADANFPRIMHAKFFHPLNDHYGFSPIEAAGASVDVHNAASGWNKALLDNAARPSGALVYQNADANLSEDQYARLKTELETNFQGARNAGRPLLLEGGLDWKSMALSPRDMDFVETKNVAAREIALALGVPPMLLGIPGDNTYSNYQEANRTFWRQTVLPMVERMAGTITSWLAPAWPQAVRLRPDLDQIPALAAERDQLWKRIGEASYLSVNEKRAAVGYSPVPGGDNVSQSGARQVARGGDA